MIAIVDYGLGNVKAFLNIYKHLSIHAYSAKNAEELLGASKIILPGVGSFDFAMTQLNKSGMLEALNSSVLLRKIPVLGVCVGMQMMAQSSEEGSLPGLGWIEGKVKKLRGSGMVNNEVFLLPHMGWNQIHSNFSHRILTGLLEFSKFYFLHSYYLDCVNKENELAFANYGQKMCAIVAQSNIFGIQCHPEKSHKFGIQFLKNFAEL